MNMLLHIGLKINFTSSRLVFRPNLHVALQYCKHKGCSYNISIGIRLLSKQ